MSGDLIRPTLQSELKSNRGRENNSLIFRSLEKLKINDYRNDQIKKDGPKIENQSYE